MFFYRTPLKDILPGWEFEVWPVDTKCDPTEGPIESFQMHCLAGHSENTFFTMATQLKSFLTQGNKKSFPIQDAVAYCLCHHPPS